MVAQAVHGFERRDERAEGERLCRDCLRSAHSQVFVGGVERSWLVDWLGWLSLFAVVGGRGGKGELAGGKVAD